MEEKQVFWEVHHLDMSSKTVFSEALPETQRAESGINLRDARDVGDCRDPAHLIGLMVEM